MNSFTYLLIGYALGCLAGCIAMYWAMKVHYEQKMFDSLPVWDGHDSTDFLGCECDWCVERREQS
jgi:hypothetical protein